MDKNNKDKGSFLGKLFGVIGLGASLYGLKKVVELYVERENTNRNLIGLDEYESFIELEKESSGLENSPMFDYAKIEGNRQGDILFNEFLQAVELNNEIPNKVFRISDIEKLISLDHLNKEDRKAYDLGIIDMLAGQEGRDYFIFKDTMNLKDIFIRELNDSKGDPSIWRKRYLEEGFIINPKYYLGYEE